MAGTKPSCFVWYDLFTTDPQAAKKFYSDLFGWQYENFDIGGTEYPMIKVGEAFLGGICGMDDPAASGPPHWSSYVSVDDVDATSARAEELGAKIVVKPTDIPKVGRFSVIADPQGAMIAAFQSLSPEPQPESDPTPDNTFCWSECLTGDSAAAAEFYSSLFGWRVEVNEMEMGGSKTKYHVFYGGEKMVGGSMDMPPQAAQAGAPPHWLYYIKVADVDAMAQKAADLGGSAECPPMDIPDTGRFCVVSDPQGAMMALYTPAQK